ncbi:MAG: HK97 family phage prohead protease [Chloroflexota bacterium]|nr:HK97 family phage prohead protease [Chloroflexota bacterium]
MNISGEPDEGGERERELLLESLERYRRGLADAPLLRKRGMGPAGGREVVTEEGRRRESTGRDGEGGAAMTFVISDEEVDRHGDVVVAQGWRLQAYRSNPVLLWAHNYGLPAIGRAAAVWPEPGLLLARMEFAPTAFAQEVAALYRSGYQQGVSVGFKPLRYEERRDGVTGAFLGVRFLEQELVEVSAVPVPANRNALLRERGPEAAGPGVTVEEVIEALREITGVPSPQ